LDEGGSKTIQGQELEQLQAALRDIATLLFDHYTRLIKQGFSTQEALQLTIAMQHSLLTKPSDTK